MSREWQEAGLTALISPIWPHCSPNLTEVYEMGALGEYSFIWNLLGYPAGVMPVTTVLSSEQTWTDSFNDHLTDQLAKSSVDSAGMPVCIQVITHAY